MRSTQEQTKERPKTQEYKSIDKRRAGMASIDRQTKRLLRNTQLCCDDEPERRASRNATDRDNTLKPTSSAVGSEGEGDDLPDDARKLY